MKKYVLIVLAMTTVLLVGTGFKFNEAIAADHDPAGPQCQSNCFWGICLCLALSPRTLPTTSGGYNEALSG